METAKIETNDDFFALVNRELHRTTLVAYSCKCGDTLFNPDKDKYLRIKYDENDIADIYEGVVTSEGLISGPKMSPQEAWNYIV